ncbi:MAG: hypothetical protein ACJ8F3_16665 [Xanthobacteraceae bacterium]
MRTTLIAGLLTLGLALGAGAPALAAPVHGSSIGHAAHAGRAIGQVQWWRYHDRHRHCAVGRHGRLHCSWW